MDGRTQGALLLAVGGVSIRLGLTDAALNYIRPEFVPMLVIAGGFLLIFGGITLVQALRGDGAHGTAAVGADGMSAAEAMAQPDDHEHGLIDLTHPLVVAEDPGHGHSQDRGPRVAWMLAAPLFAILLIAPPPLGSFAANRQSGVVQTTTSSFPPLPPVEAGAVPLNMGDFAVRALYDDQESLAGQRIRLTGFVSSHGTEPGDGWVLTRFAVACCAADGTAINVEVISGEPAPPVDQWVIVEGTWTNRDDHEIGTLTADPPLIVLESLQLTEQPRQPYEN